MRYLLILILPVFLILNSCHFFREKGLFLNREKALREIKNQQVLSAIHDTLNQNSDTLNQNSDTLNQNSKDSLNALSVPEAVKISGSSGQSFRIIVGSFGNLKNAEIALSKYRQQGYNAEIVKPEKNNQSILISIFTFDTREKADQQLQVVKSTLNKDAWVYSGKR